MYVCMRKCSYTPVHTNQCISFIVFVFFSFLKFGFCNFFVFVFVNKVTTQRYIVTVFILTSKNRKLITLVYLNMLIN